MQICENLATLVISVEFSVSDLHWIPILSGQWTRIRNPDPDPEGQKCPMKKEKKLRNFMFEVLDFQF
jgi:hypothetical protein